MAKIFTPLIASLLLGAASGVSAQQAPRPPGVEVIRAKPAAGEHGIAWIARGKDGDPHVRLLDFAGRRRLIGVQLTGLTPELRAHFGVPQDRGVLVAKVLSETPAQRAGLQAGDIILEADGDLIDHPADLSAVVRQKEEGEEVDLELRRNGETLRLRVGVEERERMLLDITPGLLEGAKALQNLSQLQLPHLDAERFEDLEDTLQRLEEYFESDEWRERLQRIEQMNLEAVEKRMQEVEQRLRELEQQLEQPPR